MRKKEKEREIWLKRLESIYTGLDPEDRKGMIMCCTAAGVLLSEDPRVVNIAGGMNSRIFVDTESGKKYVCHNIDCDL